MGENDKGNKQEAGQYIKSKIGKEAALVGFAMNQCSSLYSWSLLLLPQIGSFQFSDSEQIWSSSSLSSCTCEASSLQIQKKHNETKRNTQAPTTKTTETFVDFLTYYRLAIFIGIDTKL